MVNLVVVVPISEQNDIEYPICSEINDITVTEINSSKHKKCSTLRYGILLLIRLIVLIFLLIFMGFIICMSLVFVFNVDWDINKKSYIEQIGIYFGIGTGIIFVAILFIKNNTR
jgi:hypothetical protein